MPTLGFYMLLFYDLYYTEEFQCLVSLSALQAQRFRIGANFVRQAMSLISPVETWGRNGQAFLNTSPSSYFYTRSEMVFDSPQALCILPVPLPAIASWALQCGPKSTHKLQLAPSQIILE